MMKWLVAILLACILVVVLRAPGAVLQPGVPAPEIKAGRWFNATGDVSLTALRGKVVVLEFWATWCPPCVDSIAHLSELHERWKDRDVRIIGLTDEPSHVVAPFIAKNGLRYTVGAESRSGFEYGVQAVPHAVVIDGAGQIVWTGYPAGQLDRAVALARRKLMPE